MSNTITKNVGWILTFLSMYGLALAFGFDTRATASKALEKATSAEQHVITHEKWGMTEARKQTEDISIIKQDIEVMKTHIGYLRKAVEAKQLFNEELLKEVKRIRRFNESRSRSTGVRRPTP